MIIRWIIETFEGVPSTNVKELKELYAGAHIKIRRYLILYAHHAIVTNVNFDESTFTVIHYVIRNGGLFSKGSGVIEQEIMKFNGRTDILLINYDNRFVFNEQLPLLPNDVIVAIATFFKENNDNCQPYGLLMNNCEHFAFTCTLGFAISFQQLKIFHLVLLPFFSLPAVAIITIGSFSVQRLRRALALSKVVKFDEERKLFIVNLGSKEYISFL